MFINQEGKNDSGTSGNTCKTIAITHLNATNEQGQYLLYLSLNG